MTTPRSSLELTTAQAGRHAHQSQRRAREIYRAAPCHKVQKELTNDGDLVEQAEQRHATQQAARVDLRRLMLLDDDVEAHKRLVAGRRRRFQKLQCLLAGPDIRHLRVTRAGSACMTASRGGRRGSGGASRGKQSHNVLAVPQQLRDAAARRRLAIHHEDV